MDGGSIQYSYADLRPPPGSFSDPGFGSGIGSIFPLFGVVFIFIAVAMAIYNFKNATGKQRYSEYDIVDGDEEPDPLNERFGQKLWETAA